MLIRILSSVFIILSILFAPFWLSLLFVFSGMAYFSFYWEGVAAMFISDLLYGSRIEHFGNITYVGLIIGVILLIIIEILKKKLKFYK